SVVVTEKPSAVVAKKATPAKKYITKAPTPRPTTKMKAEDAKAKLAASTEAPAPSITEAVLPVPATTKSSTTAKGFEEKLTIIKLTDEAIEPTKGKFVIIQDPKNPVRPFQFLLKANNGQLLFESEGYKIRPRARQIETFRKSISLGSFVFDQDKAGNFKFKLLTPDGKLFGVGETYKTLDSAENASKSVANFAFSANYIEDTTIIAEVE
ncbi:MAG: DUF1508 domain-containing protein, partial [Clostridia bacterium]